MAARSIQNKPHKFTSLNEFDRAIRHIVTVPKEAVDERMKAEKAERDAERKKKPQS